MEYVGEGPDATTCFLCSSEDDGSNHVLERTATTVTILNRFPYASGHVLVAPRRHIATLGDLEGDEIPELLKAVQRAIRVLGTALGAQGFNVGLNQGQVAGASVEHLHLHVVPRWGGDTNFMPVLADVKVLPEHLTSTAERLRAAYGETT